ncbi:MAG: hypothetical protein EA359_17650, partial [Balneolaceae bacterium]
DRQSGVRFDRREKQSSVEEILRYSIFGVQYSIFKSVQYSIFKSVQLKILNSLVLRIEIQIV